MNLRRMLEIWLMLALSLQVKMMYKLVLEANGSLNLVLW